MQKKAVRVGDCVLDGKHIYIQSPTRTAFFCIFNTPFYVNEKFV